MKLIIVCIILSIVFELALACHHASDCHCGNGFAASCFEHKCNCAWVGVGKREPGDCTKDADCVDYCNNHGGGTPDCVHPGDNDHGHSKCHCN